MNSIINEVVLPKIHELENKMTEGSNPAIAALQAKNTDLEAAHAALAAQLKVLEDKLAILSITQQSQTGTCSVECPTGKLVLLSSTSAT